MSAEIVHPPPTRGASDLVATPLTQKLVGATVSSRDEINGYWFWGLVALFIGVPELLAAFSKTLKADIPWPTISNLVGKDLERHQHWIALLVVGLIVIVSVHTLTYPADKKKAGRALRKPAEEAVHLPWSGWYIVVVAVAGAGAGLIAWAAGANKNQLGYAIYLTLTVFGVLVPSMLAYWWNRVLAIPTLFATIAYLRARLGWVAALVVALLVVLMFHLALSPWPNYHFGSP
jgi:hypothetical protein